ncbi:MAG: type III secretion system chaperone [Candidimonas sp.]
MARYQDLLSGYAGLVDLKPEDLLATQEVVIEGLHIGFTVDGEEDSGDLVFFADLGKPAPTVPGDQLMRLLLQANAFWLGTGGCTLGLQPDSGHVLICGKLSVLTTDAVTLSHVVDGFADMALLWRDVVEGKTRPDSFVIAA